MPEIRKKDHTEDGVMVVMNGVIARVKPKSA